MAPFRLCSTVICCALTVSAQQTSTVRPALTYERIFGGSEIDSPTSVTTDLQGSVIVVGTTDSLDFPTTAGSYKPSLPGPLQIRSGDSQTFQSTRVGSADRVNRITFSADGSVGYADTSTIYGVKNRIYRTADGGRTWNAVAGRLPYFVSLLVVDPAAPTTVYASSLTDLYKSSDAGDSWLKLTYPKKNNYLPSSLTIDPTNSQRLFLITGFLPSQLFRSLDGGATWQQLPTGSSVYNAKTIAIDPNNPMVVYSAGSFENVFRSLDGGDSWTQLLPGVSPHFVEAKLRVDASSVLYAVTAAGIYKSTDRGETYTMSPSPGNGYLNDLQVDPLDTSRFVASVSAKGSNKGSLFETHDSGNTWISLDVLPGPIGGMVLRGNSLLIARQPTTQIFVTKWNSLAGSIIWSTYLGTASSFGQLKVVADANGFIYVAGRTIAPDFPVTPGAFLTAASSDVYQSGFVSKLSPDGSQLVWSTLIGSAQPNPNFTGYTTVTDLQVDAAGSVYVAGSSCSSNFPEKTIGNFVQTAFPGMPYTNSCALNPGGAFVAKLNPTGTALVYSAFLNGTDTAEALILDSSGKVYVSGALANRTRPGFNGNGPAGPSYLVRISASGDQVEAATLLNANASATSIALAPSGDVLVTGTTDTSLLPSFLGAFQASPSPPCYRGGSSNAYVLRLTADLSPNAFSFLGNGCDAGQSVRADRYGNIWVSGYSRSNAFGQPAGPQVLSTGFVAELTPNANGLLFSMQTDFAPQLTIAREGTIFLTLPTSRSSTLTKDFLSTSAGGTALLTRIDP